MNSAVRSWVADIEALTTPSAVVYCDGSKAERDRLIAECLAAGELIELNQQKLPGCYLHRSAPHDVARTEHLTFVSTTEKDDAGPTNNWMAPDAAREKLTPLFRGSMKGRTMYVVPFLMGPPGSPYSKVGVEITDSRYVVLNMRIMTRIGQPALDHLGDSDDFTRCLHSLGDLSPDRRFIVHFPEDNAVWSIGSGYGGNALLGKKCLALRLASYQANREGWLAEHMLIVGCQYKDGPVRYIAGAFPSACGKTNMAMLVPPDSMPGLEDVDRRRRHRVDSSRRGRPAVGGESRGWIFRRAPGHQPQHQPDGVRHDPARHDLHERRAASRRHALVGRARRPAAARRRSTGRGARGRPSSPRRRRIRTRASRRPRPTAPRCRPSSRTRAACRSTP